MCNIHKCVIHIDVWYTWMCDTHRCVIHMNVWYAYMCDMCDKYLAPRFTPHLVKYVMPVYTFASRERICGENDLGESAGWWCSKNPVNTGCKFLKCGKHGTKFSGRCFTHRRGTCKASLITYFVDDSKTPGWSIRGRRPREIPSIAGATRSYRTEE